MVLTPPPRVLPKTRACRMRGESGGGGRSALLLGPVFRVCCAAAYARERAVCVAVCGAVLVGACCARNPANVTCVGIESTRAVVCWSGADNVGRAAGRSAASRAAAEQQVRELVSRLSLGALESIDAQEAQEDASPRSPPGSPLSRPDEEVVAAASPRTNSTLPSPTASSLSVAEYIVHATSAPGSPTREALFGDSAAFTGDEVPLHSGAGDELKALNSAVSTPRTNRVSRRRPTRSTRTAVPGNPSREP